MKRAALKLQAPASRLNALLVPSVGASDKNSSVHFPADERGGALLSGFTGGVSEAQRLRDDMRRRISRDKNTWVSVR